MYYDDLVESLRLCVKYGKADDALANAGGAADAIEELSHDYEKLAEDFNGAVELLHKREKPRWIPVTERLPEQNVPCIVYNKYYGPMVGWRVDGERFRIPGSRFPDHPTHWMPLPERPKEET